MEQVVGRNRIFHYIEVCRTFKQMLSLPWRVLRSNLVAVDALYGHTLIGLICSKLLDVSLVNSSNACRRTSTNAPCTSASSGAGMFAPVFCFGVWIGFGLGVGRGPGVTEEPLMTAGGSEGLFWRGVPFSTAVAPSKAFAAPLIEYAGP